MKRIQAIAIMVSLALSLTAMAENKQTGSVANKITPLPRDLEIQLALSSLPPHLRDKATVYVLNPHKGFETFRKGTNGFHAFVARTDDAAIRGNPSYTEYRDDILVPISFDSAGSEAHMRVFFDVAEMQAEGTPVSKLKRIINDRYKTGYYKAPKRAGVSYMLSPVFRTYADPNEGDTVITMNIPHYMFYAPHITNEDIGGKFMSTYPHVLAPGPHGYIIQIVGLTEKAVINKEYAEMIAQLCEFKKEFCLPTPGTQ